MEADEGFRDITGERQLPKEKSSQVANIWGELGEKERKRPEIDITVQGSVRGSKEKDKFCFLRPYEDWRMRPSLDIKQKKERERHKIDILEPNLFRACKRNDEFGFVRSTSLPLEDWRMRPEVSFNQEPKKERKSHVKDISVQKSVRGSKRKDEFDEFDVFRLTPVPLEDLGVSFDQEPKELSGSRERQTEQVINQELQKRMIAKLKMIEDLLFQSSNMVQEQGNKLQTVEEAVKETRGLTRKNNQLQTSFDIRLYEIERHLQEERQRSRDMGQNQVENFVERTAEETRQVVTERINQLQKSFDERLDRILKDINPQVTEGNEFYNRHKNNEDEEQLIGACGVDPGEKCKPWEIDADAWLKCTEESNDFEHQANILLMQKKLPNKIALNAILSKYPYFSSIITNICKMISLYIKEKSESIVHVWAATVFSKDTSFEDENIIFVILTTDKRVEIDDLDFATFQRYLMEVKGTEHSKKIEKMEYNNPPTSEEMGQLQECLRNNAKSLMEKHSNLTRVTASWFRVDKSDKEALTIKKELCIALYVHIKGLIPLGEKPFCTEIDGFPVVVREGIFTLCRGSNEYHESVKMGCEIAAEQCGTLGAFIELESDDNVYMLTCAHVVYGLKNLQNVLQQGVCKINDDHGAVVFQPADYNKPLGKTVAAIYTSGGNGKAGMEFALVKIYKRRWPTEGTFPDDCDYLSAGFGPRTPFLFNSGNTFHTSRLRNDFVYKYGCESKLTRGAFRLNGASVRTFTFQDNILGTELVLHDQIEITNIETAFAVNGDSGAMVFVKDKQELSAIGMFEGNIKGTNVYVCTPICDVVDEISRISNRQCRLKRFLPLGSEMNNPQIHDRETSLSLNLHERLEGLEQGFAQDLAIQKQEITNEISNQQNIQREEMKNLSEELKRQGEENTKQNQEIKERQERQENQNKELKEELKRQGDEFIKQSQEIKQRQVRQEMQSKELKEELKRQSEELKRQGDEHIKQSQEIKQRQEMQEMHSQELKEELKRQGEEHIRLSTEIKEQQEKQNEELKRQADNTQKILALLTQL